MAPRLNNYSIRFSGTFEAPEAQLRKWTENNGGTFERQLSSSTTHLIVTKANWRARVPEVKAALQDKSIKIVDYEWFDDRLRLGGRVSETKYLWTTIDEEAIKQVAKEAKAAEREEKRVAREKEKKKRDSKRIDWGGALLQHTNAVARVVDDDSSEEDSEDSSKRELAEEFAKGAKQAKKDLMSDNHHVYMDITGFVYDICLTKAMVELSRLDRASITSSKLYETNADPHSYAVVVKMAEKDPQDHDTTTVQGVNFATAFKCWRDNFKTLTGNDWDNRVQKFSDQPALALLPRPNITIIAPSKSSPPGKLSKLTKKPSSKGKEKEEQNSDEPTAEELQERLNTAFTRQKYRYRLPSKSKPRGTMPDGSHYKHQDNKAVYDLFGKTADRGAEAMKIKEEAKEEAKRLKKLVNRKKKPIEIVVIDSDDEEEDSEEDEGSDEDEDMEGGEENGYVAVNAVGSDVEMKVVDTNGPAIEQDFAMVDAPAAQV
ncbi:hypothetical protein E4T39_08640 [Aureobasidium subglaciale]|nr:hypothetical protein E4T39_08640 [Aureobasidium subglaciale]